ncbi:MAG: molybdopterin molybdotransferase MoeA [Halobacteriales archaeon]
MPHDGGVKRRTRVAAALEAIEEHLTPPERTERRAPAGSAGRVLAEAVTAVRDVPGYDRVTVDGYAVRAADTVGAGGRSPAILERGDEPGPGVAVPVTAGAPLPAGATAVVPASAATAVDGEVEIGDPVPEAAGVEPAGADVATGERLYDAGREVEAADVAVLRAAGPEAVTVHAEPAVGVVPIGDRLVRGDPGEGEVLETDAATLARLAEARGAVPTRREPVPADPEPIRVALRRDLPKDLVVTVGGTGPGENDRVPAVMDAEGEVTVRGVAMEPGRTATVGSVEGTPVLALPGEPPACLAAALLLLGPAVRRLARRDAWPGPAVEADLERKVESAPGIRTVVGAAVDDGRADPVALGGYAALTRADGWFAVPESREGLPAGETVTVTGFQGTP